MVAIVARARVSMAGPDKTIDNADDPWQVRPRVTPGRRRRTDPDADALETDLSVEAGPAATWGEDELAPATPEPAAGQARTFLGPAQGSTVSTAPLTPSVGAPQPSPTSAFGQPQNGSHFSNNHPYPQPTRKPRSVSSDLAALAGLVIVSLMVFQCVANIGSTNGPDSSGPLVADQATGTTAIPTTTSGYERPSTALRPIDAPFFGRLTIGVLVPQTGADANLAPAMMAAAQLAEEDVNRAGGTRTTAIEVVIGDEGSHPTITEALDDDPNSIAIETVARLLDTDNVDAIVGGIGPGAEAEITNLALEAGALHYRLEDPLLNSTGPRAPSDRLNIRAGADLDLEARLVATALSDAARPISIIVAETDPYGMALAEQVLTLVDTAAESDPQAPLRTQIFPYANNQASVDAATAQAQPAETVLIVGHTAAPGSTINAASRPDGTPPISTLEVLAALANQDVRGSNTPILVTAAEANSSLGARLGPDFDPTLLDGVRGVTIDAPILPGFRGRLEQRIGPDVTELDDEAVIRAAELYDAIIVVALASHERGIDEARQFTEVISGVSRAGTRCVTFEACRAVLDTRNGIDDHKSIDYDGLSGAGQIGQTGRPTFATGRLVTFDANGTLQLVTGADGALQAFAE